MTNLELTDKLYAVPAFAGLNTLLIQLGIPPRFRSAALDQFGMVLLLMLIGWPLVIYVVYQTGQTRSSVALEDELWTLLYACFLNSLYFNKDAVLAQSIGKRVCHLQVIDRKTKRAAGPLKCLVRNLTLMAWPVELLFLLIIKNRRLGDFITNTEVVEFKAEYNKRFSQLEFLSSILIAMIIFFLCITLTRG
jgi:uncharacterized RDD family membrane protein YckC